MSTLRFVFVMLIGIVLPGGLQSAHAQFYGGGFNGPGFGSPYGMGGYGGYYGGPYGGYPTTMNGLGYNPGYSAFGGPGYLPLGGYGGLSTSAMGVNGNGWNSYPFSGIRPYAVDYVPHVQPVQTAVPVSPPVVHSGADIKLACPKSVESSLTYLLNGASYTIQPGYSQFFRDDRTWKLEFHRGGEASELVAYTLKPGTFHFAVGSSGWELRQVVAPQSSNLPPAPQPIPSPSLTPTPQPPRT